LLDLVAVELLDLVAVELLDLVAVELLDLVALVELLDQVEQLDQVHGFVTSAPSIRIRPPASFSSTCRLPTTSGAAE